MTALKVSMKKFITISIFAATFLGALAVAHVHPVAAQEGQEGLSIPPALNTEDPAKHARSVLVAQVDMMNVSLQQIADTHYGITFSLKSADVISQKAYHRIVLIDENDHEVYIQGDGSAVDLIPQGTTKASAPLDVPGGLEGDFVVMVYVTNADGLPLATGNAGQVSLSNTAQVTPSIKECTTEESPINPDSLITVTCDLMEKGAPLTKLVGTVFPSRSAKPVEVVSKTITKNTVVYELSKLTVPGRYEIVSQLFGTEGPVGASFLTEVVIAGNRAQISNIILDKASYEAGETAKVTGALSTYGYVKGELFATARLKTSDGSVCGEIIKKEVEVPNSIVLEIPMTQTCVSPTIEMTLEDKEGNVLDTGTSVVPPPPVDETITPNTVPIGEFPLMVFVSLAFALILLAVLGVRKLLADRNAVVNENINQ